MTEVPDTFGDIAEKIYQMIPKLGDCVFSTDMQDPLSVKAQERTRRGSSEGIL